MWERLLSLKKQNLITIRKNEMTLTAIGKEFLKSKNKEKVLWTVAISERMKSIKNPNIFRIVLIEISKMNSTQRKNITRRVSAGYDIKFDELTEKDDETYELLVKKIARKKKNENKVRKTIMTGLYSKNYGSLKICNAPTITINKFLSNENNSLRF